MTVLKLQSIKTTADDANNILPVDIPVLDLECTNILISLPLPEVEDFFEWTFLKTKEIEQSTRLQNSTDWHEKRKFRFTSSNFGMLCKRSKAFGIEFFENLWAEKRLDHVKSIQHGRKEERNAEQLYCTNTGNKVYKCGLIIHPYAPFLGTSPDGLVITSMGEIGLVEFKCPYGSKSGCLKEALKLKTFHLKEDENKQIVVNNKHNYYYQVQGQMLICGIKWCDLCTYFKKSNETVIVRVDFDPFFCTEMFENLTNMYNVYLSF